MIVHLSSLSRDGKANLILAVTVVLAAVLAHVAGGVSWTWIGLYAAGFVVLAAVSVAITAVGNLYRRVDWTDPQREAELLGFGRELQARVDRATDGTRRPVHPLDLPGVPESEAA